MAVFELRPVSMSDGSFAPAWFDDDAHLWDDKRLTSAAALADSWQPPKLRLHRPVAGPTTVLFNPNALAVSQGIRDELCRYEEIEFLPVDIEGHGTFYVLHVTSAVEVPRGTTLRSAAVSGNIVQIDAFPQSYEPMSAFFRVLQPEGSAARSIGATTRAIYLSASGALAVEGVARPYLMARRLAGA